MPDKKITELQVAPPITGDDIGILVNNGTDYQYAFSQLLSYISQNIATGCNVTFVSTVPQNNTGKNSDVAINITTGAFYQKQVNNWINTYTLPASSTSNGSGITYGLGEPNASSGQINDTYINTANGRFYQKATAGWQQVFSMLNGPTGGPGPKGDTGLPGLNGKSLLNGLLDPSNQATGVDGDFYINTSTYTLFGPKRNSDWGSGTVIVPIDFDLKADKTYVDRLIEDSGFIKSDDIDQGLTITSEKKIKLDLESKSLITPTLSVTWLLHKADGSDYMNPVSSLKALTVDKGVKADLAAKYNYPAPSPVQSLPQPQTAGGLFAGTPFPAANTPSGTVPLNNIVADSTYNVTFAKPKSGLIVAGSQVAFPTGNDTTSDSASIAFRGRGFLISAADLTLQQIQENYNAGAFQASRARTFNSVTAGVGNFIWYIYDAALGEYTSIILNGVEAYFTAFAFQSRVTIVNNAGVNTSLIIGRSNAPNAFTNVSLAFS
ncbi:hypothetical protein MUGA111182_09735 [Mucilaginibacter galii]|uniref:Collagen-like protein n=1 Tax=Mucilaginibacter galii TaxID=2005073 RepID=A0A917JAX3_9SPHI|nr:hypothetical protein [Mucilaginibacter galii]GGI51197.1 hypothetical protein GCM10011425_24090 [Mucilaginibacter galii]